MAVRLLKLREDLAEGALLGSRERTAGIQGFWGIHGDGAESPFWHKKRGTASSRAASGSLAVSYVVACLLFGDSGLCVRIPPRIFGLLAVVPTFVLARRWLSGTAALLSAFLLAASPVHIWYSQEARPY
jgi:hypothetical protein